MKYTIKDGQVYGYDPDQIDLYHHRINNDGHDPYEIPPQIITTDDVKTAITKRRWQIETGGITLPNGVRVATGIDDQNRITSVIANANLAGVETVDFKAESGWVTVTVQELQAISAAIAVHVQACFTAERAHHEAIDALAEQHEGAALQAALSAYDIEQGWPV